MRTRKTIVPSFSTDAVTFFFPKSWKEMTQEQLSLVLQTMAEVPDQHTQKVKSILRMNNVHVVRRWKKGWLCFCWRTWRKRAFFIIYPWQMQWMADKLKWMEDYSSMQNRLMHAAGGWAVDMTLHGVSFGDYLQLEKWYQMYLTTKNDAFIEKMGHELYRTKDDKPTEKPLRPFEILGVVLWWVYIKEVFARAFPKFFRRAGASESVEDTKESIVKQMNIQIRALTEGDVTKEHIILDDIDCWRALTELNEKAREAQELERNRKSMKK